MSNVFSAVQNSILSSRHEYLVLGEWIAKQRTTQGLEQKPLSRSLGKPEQFLNKIKQGKQRIDLVEFADLLAQLYPEKYGTLIQLLESLYKLLQNAGITKTSDPNSATCCSRNRANCDLHIIATASMTGCSSATTVHEL